MAADDPVSVALLTNSVAEFVSALIGVELPEVVRGCW